MGDTLQLGMLKPYDVGPDKVALARVNKTVNHFHRSSKVTFH